MLRGRVVEGGVAFKLIVTRSKFHLTSLRDLDILIAKDFSMSCYRLQSLATGLRWQATQFHLAG